MYLNLNFGYSTKFKPQTASCLVLDREYQRKFWLVTPALKGGRGFWFADNPNYIFNARMEVVDFSHVANVSPRHGKIIGLEILKSLQLLASIANLTFIEGVIDSVGVFHIIFNNPFIKCFKPLKGIADGRAKEYTATSTVDAVAHRADCYLRSPDQPYNFGRFTMLLKVANILYGRFKVEKWLKVGSVIGDSVSRINGVVLSGCLPDFKANCLFVMQSKQLDHFDGFYGGDLYIDIAFRAGEYVDVENADLFGVELGKIFPDDTLPQKQIYVPKKPLFLGLYDEDGCILRKHRA